MCVGYIKKKKGGGKEWADCGSSAASTWCEHLLPTKAGIMGPQDRAGIMISFPYKFGSLLKSHLEHFFWASWPVPSPVSAPGATRSTSLCWGESILSGLYPLSLDTSAARRARWWGDHSWQSCEILIGPDFNRFTSEDWFPVVMRNAQATQHLVSATFLAGNGTGIAVKLSLAFYQLFPSTCYSFL